MVQRENEGFVSLCAFSEDVGKHSIASWTCSCGVKAESKHLTSCSLWSARINWNQRFPFHLRISWENLVIWDKYTSKT